MTPTNPSVSLREITRDTVRPICRIEVAPEQRRFVASIAASIAEAHFSPEAWFRAIYAGDEPVGFVMLSIVPEKTEYYVWRYLIGIEHQGRGYGRAAMLLVIEHVRSLGAAELLLGYVPGEGEPRAFYEKLGFAATGAVEDGEIVMALRL
ncbi:MAG: GNAT family N-acetyltransferase [Candidatus Eisenbacteria bacterium]|nr:GNAT family N-acetyltransferase [Candidatus Eisenbacteria bacterium]